MNHMKWKPKEADLGFKAIQGYMETLSWGKKEEELVADAGRHELSGLHLTSIPCGVDEI